MERFCRSYFGVVQDRKGQSVSSSFETVEPAFSATFGMPPQGVSPYHLMGRASQRWKWFAHHKRDALVAKMKGAEGRGAEP